MSNNINAEATPVDPTAADTTTATTSSKAESASQEQDTSAAYNEETGEINWDCPCLGGMADGPCGEEFKTAFSCFVYSEAEPKGMDCVDAFKLMQDCFRRYPEAYADELADVDDEENKELEGLEGLDDEFWDGPLSTSDKNQRYHNDNHNDEDSLQSLLNETAPR
ncbi:hypothetical protein BDF19DRAFT_433173 [Syncephalis fuscata]|nr:hypothetical protein BDF19DRAFT_433173 [Syncephalis fuscata]